MFWGLSNSSQWNRCIRCAFTGDEAETRSEAVRCEDALLVAPFPEPHLAFQT